MRGPSVAVRAAMLTATVGIQRVGEGDIWALILGKDRLGGIPKIRCFDRAPLVVVQGTRIDVYVKTLVLVWDVAAGSPPGSPRHRVAHHKGPAVRKPQECSAIRGCQNDWSWYPIASLSVSDLHLGIRRVTKWLYAPFTLASLLRSFQPILLPSAHPPQPWLLRFLISTTATSPAGSSA